MIPDINTMELFESSALNQKDFEVFYTQAQLLFRYARESGLLALDESSKNPALPAIFRKGLEMVMSGKKPANIKSLLTEMILTHRGNPREYAMGVLYLQSILCLQRGENEILLKMRLAALIGIETLNDVIYELDVK